MSSIVRSMSPRVAAAVVTSLLVTAFIFQGPAAADHNQHIHAFLLADADNHSNTANIIDGKLQVGDEAGPLTVDGIVNVDNTGGPLEVKGDVLVGDGTGPLTVDGTVDLAGPVSVSGPVTAQPAPAATPLVAFFEEQFNSGSPGAPSHQVYEGASDTTHLAISSISLTAQISGALIVQATDCAGNFTGTLVFSPVGFSMTHLPFPEPLVVAGRCLEVTQSSDFGGALAWGTIGGYEL